MGTHGNRLITQVDKSIHFCTGSPVFSSSLPSYHLYFVSFYVWHVQCCVWLCVVYISLDWSFYLLISNEVTSFFLFSVNEEATTKEHMNIKESKVVTNQDFRLILIFLKVGPCIQELEHCIQKVSKIFNLPLSFPTETPNFIIFVRFQIGGWM